MSDKERDEIQDTDEPKKPETGKPYDGLTTADDPEGGQTQGSGGNPPPPGGGGN